ncbi:beta-lactamase [Blastocystis sp. ATCC 50177/Nand II]|uniref:Beta-lactamase n=1 Tax=Blastocystis sp. subtype 1 (strain ATCC 50177 / NandII) TaxID=478820 RepID=A0A196SB23_BLAHN|nr:beta-lactamase [Blastocystis sp. ATCC 50177/Nand II]
MMITNGSYRENAYLMWDDILRQGVLIDPGEEPSKIIEALLKCQVDVDKILLTHGHHDHCSGIAKLENEIGEIPVYMNQADAPLFRGVLDEAKTLGLHIPVNYVKDNDTVVCGSRTGNVITTPGHTPGCVCYRFGSFLFAGDTLFKGSIGRTDLEGGESKAIIDSIQKKLFSLPYATTVLSGHGPITTLADEMANNPYVAM